MMWVTTCLSWSLKVRDALLITRCSTVPKTRQLALALTAFHPLSPLFALVYGPQKVILRPSLLKPACSQILRPSLLKPACSQLGCARRRQISRIVPHLAIRGGFSRTVLLPSTPIQILKRDIVGSCDFDSGIWPVPIDPESVWFELNGEVLDEEVGVGRLTAWAESYEDEVVVQVGEERVPWNAPTHL